MTAAVSPSSFPNHRPDGSTSASWRPLVPAHDQLEEIFGGGVGRACACRGHSRALWEAVMV